MITSRFLGSTLLVAGTAIGAAMLALPVATGTYGFVPSTLIFIVCWACMAFTGLLMLEVNLWLPKDTNLISMAHRTLGRGGEIVAWVTYLLLLYALLSAYTTGMGALLADSINSAVNLNVPDWIGSLIFVFLGASFIYFGAQSVDPINRLLIAGLVVIYVILVFQLTPHIDIGVLSHQKPKFILFALPIAVVSFGYQIIIPTIRNYLHGDVRKLRWAILLGSFIPLLVYIIWELIILGVVPIEGSGGLEQN